jgi:chromosome segregation ATPase
MHNKEIENELEAWLAFLSMDEPEMIIKLIEAYPKFQKIYEQIYGMCRNIEEVVAMFSEELRELDRNTVQYMIDVMQDEINAQKGTIDEQKSMINEKQSQLDEKQSQLDEKQSQLDEKQSQLDEKQLQLDEQKSTINEQRLQLEAALQRIKELEGLS